MHQLFLGHPVLVPSFVRSCDDYQQNISEHLLQGEVLIEPADGFVVQLHYSGSTMR